MNKYLFIINPKARKGKGSRIVQRLERLLKIHRLDARMVFTVAPGHATELARSAQNPFIIAVGGDGTINEVVNGIVGTSKTLGIIPNGSGNDLAKPLAVPIDPDKAFETLISEKIIRIDCATIRVGASYSSALISWEPERYFANGVGIGFDAQVAERSNNMRLLSGAAAYVASVFITLGKYIAPAFNIDIDSVVHARHNLLIAIGNGPCVAGVFYLTPDARIDDGYLDVCEIADLSILKILRLMPKALTGAHVKIDGVRMSRGQQIHVSSLAPFFVHADGEVVGRDVTNVEIRIAKDAVKVIAG